MVDSFGTIKQMKEYADKYNVPIITDEGIEYIKDYIEKNAVRKILEIGTAIGYSAIMMALCDSDIEVTTIERDEKRYLEAIKNVKKLNLERRINLIYNDAFQVNLTDKYDLIFIDAAKAQNTKFFEKFAANLSDKGVIITDNLSFHGLVAKSDDEIESRNLRALVRKIRDYIAFLQNNKDYETEFLDIGDGIAVSRKKSSE